MYGDRASQPAAAPENDGVYYRVTDEGDIVEQSDGSTWTEIAAGGGGGAGVVVQQVQTQTGAFATGTTQIPVDDTIPQNTEGTEFMTLAITPTDAGNDLYIDVVLNASSSSATRWIIAALFRDSGADALAVGMSYHETATAFSTIKFSCKVAAGSTSATTFKVRAGANDTGTTTFNGQAGGRIMGSVLLSSITITEIAP